MVHTENTWLAILSFFAISKIRSPAWEYDTNLPTDRPTERPTDREKGRKKWWPFIHSFIQNSFAAQTMWCTWQWHRQCIFCSKNILNWNARNYIAINRQQKDPCKMTSTQRASERAREAHTLLRNVMNMNVMIFSMLAPLKQLQTLWRQIAIRQNQTEPYMNIEQSTANSNNTEPAERTNDWMNGIK